LPFGRPRAWSHDSRHIFYEHQLEGEFAAMRYTLADDKIEKIVSLEGIRRLEGSLGHWSGLDPTDAPLLLRNKGSQQVYALDWDAP
jgi:hypothetical protein